MHDIKLFRLRDNMAEELAGHFAHLERDLQNLVEKNLQAIFGIKFLAREYNTGRFHSGQIDTLGIDENYCPVIIEYKRRNNENIITQCLYYLDWLMEHQGEFMMLLRKSGEYNPDRVIEFSGARLICLASSFNRYDERAICQIDRNVELIRYKFFSDDLLLLELLNASPGANACQGLLQTRQQDDKAPIGMPLPMQLRIRNMTPETEDMYLALLSYAETLGEDITIKFLKHSIALTRIKNFMAIQPQKNFIKIWLNLNPDEFNLENGFCRDVRDIGHQTSGNLEIDIHNMEELEKAREFIKMAYENN